MPDPPRDHPSHANHEILAAYQDIGCRDWPMEHRPRTIERFDLPISSGEAFVFDHVSIPRPMGRLPRHFSMKPARLRQALLSSPSPSASQVTCRKRSDPGYRPPDRYRLFLWRNGGDGAHRLGISGSLLFCDILVESSMLTVTHTPWREAGRFPVQVVAKVHFQNADAPSISRSRQRLTSVSDHIETSEPNA